MELEISGLPEPEFSAQGEEIFELVVLVVVASARMVVVAPFLDGSVVVVVETEVEAIVVSAEISVSECVALREGALEIVA